MNVKLFVDFHCKAASTGKIILESISESSFSHKKTSLQDCMDRGDRLLARKRGHQREGEIHREYLKNEDKSHLHSV